MHRQSTVVLAGIAMLAFAKSVAALSLAVDLSPRESDVIGACGCAGPHDYSAYDRTIVLDPNDPAAFLRRGEAYSGNGEYDRAIGDFSRAIELDPRHAGAHLKRGLAYADRRERDQAIADFTRVIELAPDSADAYYHRAQAFQWKSDSARAIADFSRAIEIDSGHADAHFGRGSEFWKAGRRDLANADFDAYDRASLQSEKGFGHSLLAQSYAAIGHPERAAAHLSEEIMLQPWSSTLLRDRALAFLELGKIESARADLERARVLKLDRRSAREALAKLREAERKARSDPASH